MVRRLVFYGADQLHLVDRTVLVNHGIEAHVRARTIAVDHGKAVPLGLPSEGDDFLVFVRELEHFHGAVWLFDPVGFRVWGFGFRV